MSVPDPRITRDMVIERARAHSASSGEEDPEFREVSLDSLSGLTRRLAADGRLWLAPAGATGGDYPFWLVVMQGRFGELSPLLPDGRPVPGMPPCSGGVRRLGVMWVLMNADTGHVTATGFYPDDVKP